MHYLEESTNQAIETLSVSALNQIAKHCESMSKLLRQQLREATFDTSKEKIDLFRKVNPKISDLESLGYFAKEMIKYQTK